MSSETARIYDFTAHRMQRQARRQRAAGVRRQFLWGNPATGQVTVEFPPGSGVRNPSRNASLG